MKKRRQSTHDLPVLFQILYPACVVSLVNIIKSHLRLQQLFLIYYELCFLDVSIGHYLHSYYYYISYYYSVVCYYHC